MTIEIKVPALGESVSEASIAKLHVKIGEAVKADQLILELETDKVTLEVNAPSNGSITDLKVKEGDNVKVGDIVALMEAGAGVVVSATKNNDESANKTSTISANTSSNNSNLANNFLSPAPKKLVAENNVDISKINGSGKDGRITKGDILESLNSVTPTNTNSLQSSSSKPTERVKMSKLRQKIAQRLKESQNTAAILTTFNEVDMGAIMAIRSDYKEIFEKKHGVKLGFMSFFVKACVTVLKELPAVNA